MSENKKTYDPKAYDAGKKDLDDSIIVAWVGNTDIDNMNAVFYSQFEKLSPYYLRENKLDTIKKRIAGDNLKPIEMKGLNGPIKTLIEGSRPKEVFLLLSHDFEEDGPMVKEWVERSLDTEKTKVHLIKTGVLNPYSFNEVNNALFKASREYWKDYKPQDFVFLITPGTSTMVAATLYFSQTEFNHSRTFVTYDPKIVKHGGKQFEEVKVVGSMPSSLGTDFKADNSTVSKEKIDYIVKYFGKVPKMCMLITGPSGVGKSYTAHKIHELVDGPNTNYQECNCAELSSGEDSNIFRSELFGAKKDAFSGCNRDKKGLFELAKGGTIFLDEIGEIPFDKQAMLLRVLQERKCIPMGGEKKDEVDISDVRIIAATNKDLAQAVADGKFREDLYYRLAMCPIKVDSVYNMILKNKKGFSNLVKELLVSIGKENNNYLQSCARMVNQSHINAIAEYDWPGNVRQLRQVLTLACIKAKVDGKESITYKDVFDNLPDEEEAAKL